MKILVIGSACSGKSTFARKLERKTGLPLYHLDKYIWQEYWKKTPEEVFTKKLEEILSRDKWICEGFNLPTLREQVESADRIVYIRKSHLQLTLNYFKRLLEYRNISRPDMPEGNVEHLSLSYMKWLWKYDNNTILIQIREYVGNKPIDIISTKHEADSYIKSFNKHW